MTGSREESYSQPRREPNMDNTVSPDPIEAADDSDRTEIPAFLRRQAN